MAPPLGSWTRVFRLLATTFIASFTASLLSLRSGFLLMFCVGSTTATFRTCLISDRLFFHPTAGSTAAEMVVDLCPRRQAPRARETSLEETGPPSSEARCLVSVGVLTQSCFGKALEHLHALLFVDMKRGC